MLFGDTSGPIYTPCDVERMRETHDIAILLLGNYGEFCFCTDVAAKCVIETYTSDMTDIMQAAKRVVQSVLKWQRQHALVTEDRCGRSRLTVLTNKGYPFLVVSRTVEASNQFCEDRF